MLRCNEAKVVARARAARHEQAEAGGTTRRHCAATANATGTHWPRPLAQPTVRPSDRALGVRADGTVVVQCEQPAMASELTPDEQQQQQRRRHPADDRALAMMQFMRPTSMLHAALDIVAGWAQVIEVLASHIIESVLGADSTVSGRAVDSYATWSWLQELPSADEVTHSVAARLDCDDIEDTVGSMIYDLQACLVMVDNSRSESTCTVAKARTHQAGKQLVDSMHSALDCIRKPRALIFIPNAKEGHPTWIHALAKASANVVVYWVTIAQMLGRPNLTPPHLYRRVDGSAIVASFAKLSKHAVCRALPDECGCTNGRRLAWLEDALEREQVHAAALAKRSRVAGAQPHEGEVGTRAECDD